MDEVLDPGGWSLTEDEISALYVQMHDVRSSWERDRQVIAGIGPARTRNKVMGGGSRLLHFFHTLHTKCRHPNSKYRMQEIIQMPMIG